MALAINSNDHVFAGTFFGAYRSTDNGDTWTSINTGLTSFYVYSLLVNSEGYAFAGTRSPGGVFRSTQTTVVSPPPAPILASPPDGATNQSTIIRLHWISSPRAETYRLQVSLDSVFTAVILDDSAVTDSSKQVGPLSAYTLHYWRVSATNVGGTSDWSDIWTFTTGPLLGDFNQDNRVDVSDLVVFASHFGLSAGDAGYDGSYDLTGDGSVDVSDLVMFASVFGTTSPSSNRFHGFGSSQQ